MFDEMTLFDEKDRKNQTITIRLSKKQRERIYLMARSKGVNVTKLLFELIGQENKRLIDEGYIDVYGDDLPF